MARDVSPPLAMGSFAEHEDRLLDAVDERTAGSAANANSPVNRSLRGCLLS